MRKLVVLTFVSLDGVVQAPGGKGEDPSGGFKYEGWTVPFFDEMSGEEMDRQMGMPFDLLLGRKTYDIFASYWPQHEEGLAGAPFKKATKYVVSNCGVDLSWENSVQIKGDAAGEIRKLKQSDGPMLQVHGSSNLIQTLLENDLVDEFWLKTFPVVLGKGKRLFGEGTLAAAFKLTSASVTPSGVVFANYERNGEVQTGSF